MKVGKQYESDLPENDERFLLQRLILQVIGILLKSQQAEVYIQLLMELDEEMQENMQKIVEECLRDIDENPSIDGGDSLNDDQPVPFSNRSGTHFEN